MVERLEECARKEFKLDHIPQGSKISIRKSLTQVWKTTGKKPKQLAEIPEPPEELTYLFDYYFEAQTTEELTFSELSAFSNLTNKNLATYEIQIIRKLDQIYWSAKRE